MAATKSVNNDREWMKIIRKYQVADTKRAVWQVINSVLPFFVLFVLMFFALDVSFWLMLPLALLTAGFQMRMFIIQHDCGHNSFFPSKRANNILGGILGVFTLTPYAYWRKTHAIHHATSGDLDFRGIGDVEVRTMQEFSDMNWWGRLRYRAFRNPVFMFGLAPAILFLIIHRIPLNIPPQWKRERRSVYQTDIAWAVYVIGMMLIFGPGKFWIVYLTTSIIASTLGIWLFWVQHQFEETYWRWHEEWDYTRAALEGSSYLKLPKLFQWFSGNIGFHHIHHLSPLIPNYTLEKAYNENEFLRDVSTLNIRMGIQTMFKHLWDEQEERLVTFWEARKLRAMREYRKPVRTTPAA
jgi:omega-6 fatty acid desaturase (delta-12 desaturase)